eukprot:NODE_623_length_1297_cov_197.490385_g490_i0.p1 GENE.NODE_623_length_1297_cov_197.490385_g490_i0~~NODE_623_length_1297_cov_197.490385_g490_i0.p1  ORF type:complete len:375 (-),score=109.30 NODE_623_length_1297_cov_197.490385_g490_i0:143-1267(-)
MGAPRHTQSMNPFVPFPFLGSLSGFGASLPSFSPSLCYAPPCFGGGFPTASPFGSPFFPPTFPSSFPAFPSFGSSFPAMTPSFGLSLTAPPAPSAETPAFPPAPEAPVAVPTAEGEPVPTAEAQAPEEIPDDHEHNLECGHFYNTLGYWRSRGTAAAIRMMLAYQGVEYFNKFYDPTENPDGTWDVSQWMDHKENILKHNNPLIDLPYLEAVDDDGGIVLAQPSAILNHLGRRFNLIGCTEIDAAKSDMLTEQCHDLRSAWNKLFYETRQEDFEKAKEGYFAPGGAFEEQLTKFEEWLEAQGTTFLVEEDHPITADFVFWELLDIHQLLQPAALDAFPRVKDFYQGFRGLEGLQEYFASDLYKLPPNDPMTSIR